ncbi:EamA family transporter, partial [bacterium]|nr:EamA family transporter [bacterium]
VLAAVISVSGVYFLLNSDGWALQVAQFLNPPVLLIVVSVVLWALMFIKTQSITRGIPAVFVACFTTGCLSVTSLPFALAEGPWHFEKIDFSLGVLLLINGPLAFGLGLWAIYRSLKIFHPMLMSLMMLLGPVAALLVSTQFFDEELRGGQVLGVFLIIGGLLCKIFGSDSKGNSPTGSMERTGA